MIYFSKIEAYFAGELTDEAQAVFEQELAENVILQQEFEAYETAQSLFGFTADQLSAPAIVTPEATETADALILFAANNLSEAEILSTTSETAIIKTLKPQQNRTAWLVAASMLMILSLIGWNFYNQPVSGMFEKSIVIQSNSPSKIIPLEDKAIEKRELAASPIIADASQKTKEKKPADRIYKPAKIVVDKNEISASTEKGNPTLIKQPIASNSAPHEIATQAVIKDDQSITYKAVKTVTLQADFHAKAGSDLVTTAEQDKSITTSLIANERINAGERVIYEAEQTITLQHGFHAVAGTDFTAKTKLNKMVPIDVTTNSIIKEKETVVFKAGNSITLKPGFHAKAGAGFIAAIEK